MANITDVAKLAEVSKTTVSRVINRPELVGDKTRKRVLDAMSRLDYTPSPMARWLTLRKTQNLAVVCVGGKQYRNSFFLLEVVDGIRDRASELEYHTLLFSGILGTEQELIRRKVMKENRADAVIVVGSDLEPGAIIALNSRKIPFILINRSYVGENIHWVSAKVREGMFKVIKYLIELGHREIGFVGNIQSSATFRERLEGYRSALEQSGIPFVDELAPVMRSPREMDREKAGAEVAEKMLRRLRPTAIACATDYLAIGAMRALKSMGFSMPGDISITGFDDIAIADYLEPPLTTARMPMYEMGAAAAEMAILRLAHPDRKFRNRMLDTKLVVRESCSAPRR
ncbi:MAG: LacI family DNA-binding transcriptional regulator [Firmicutes bacterium]|nr:LacI family DNA-binding transcriptional regulator [Bacillota bacterium]